MGAITPVQPTLPRNASGPETATQQNGAVATDGRGAVEQNTFDQNTGEPNTFDQNVADGDPTDTAKDLGTGGGTGGGTETSRPGGPPPGSQNWPGNGGGGWNGRGEAGGHHNGGGYHNGGYGNGNGNGYGGYGRGNPEGRGPGSSHRGDYDPSHSAGDYPGNSTGEFSHPLSNTIGQLGRLVTDIFSPGNHATDTPIRHYDPSSGDGQGGQTIIRESHAPPPATQNPAPGGGTRPEGSGHNGSTNPTGTANPAGTTNPAGTAQAPRGEAANPTARGADGPAAGQTGRGAETPATAAGQLARGAEAAPAAGTPGQQVLQGAGLLPTMQAVLQTLAAPPSALLPQSAEEQAALLQQGSAQNPRGEALARELLRGMPTQLPMAPGQLAPEQQAEERTLPNTLADPRRQAQAEQAQARAATDADAQARADQRADARNLANPRAADALVRTDANDPRLAREAADKTRNATLSEGLRAQQQADAAKRPGLLAAMAESGSLRGSATTLARHALDWVGQLAKELGIGANDGEEGVHALRVVAGLVIAATGVLVAIGALYALRVMLHGG